MHKNINIASVQIRQTNESSNFNQVNLNALNVAHRSREDFKSVLWVWV